VSLPGHFREHARMLGGTLYGVLLPAMAADLEAGGPVAQICTGREDARFDDLIQLRLLAGLHRIVLTGRAPELVEFYPNLGGNADPAFAWPVAREVLAHHVDELCEALAVAPQTNEPGRAAALLVGIFEVVRRSGLERIRLLEVGASAGLNLLVDEFHISGESWQFGPPDSPVQLVDAVVGAVTPASFAIVERRGCDLEPVDASSPDGRLRLTSFVWPHQVQRHARLAAALDVASHHPVEVDQAPASEWLGRQLATAPADGVLTVVWHSITRIYWPVDEVTAVAHLIDQARERMPLARVAMEDPDPAREGESTLSVEFVGSAAAVAVATVAPHGLPVRSRVLE